MYVKQILEVLCNHIMIFRQSKLILIYKLVILEAVMIGLYLVVRVPKIVISTQLDSEILSSINYLSLIYFAILSSLEIVLVAYTTLSWSLEEYIIQNGTISHIYGVFKRYENTYSLKNISSVNVNQSFLSNLFNIGTIKVFSPVLKQDFYIENVDNPQKVADLIKEEVESPKDKIIFRNR